MGEYDFVLRFAMPRTGDVAHHAARLKAEGCDDATFGNRSVALRFQCNAPNPEVAVLGALSAAMRALPGARLVDAFASGARATGA
jgi:hypothetical protein